VCQENKELRANCEAQEKLLHDRDRTNRGLQKQIEHFQQDSLRQKMTNKELLSKLNDVELSKLNAEKEKT
jgi:hypothetical protein